MKRWGLGVLWEGKSEWERVEGGYSTICTEENTKSITVFHHFDI
jgi:hypothetical protein